jgi:hypothetical protein
MNKKQEEFDLSEKIQVILSGDILDVEDVKEFISLIKTKVLTDWKGQNEFIDWLEDKVGDKLK